MGERDCKIIKKIEKMFIKALLISFWQLTRKVIFAKRPKVLFYYPQHFNRSAKATNPFFDRMLETCDKHGICYQLIEEPDWGTDKPRNPKAIKGDALFVLITIIRKIVLMCGMKDEIKRECITAKVVNVLTFGRLSREKYITISGSMLEIFLYLNRNAVVYDMQHGILYKKHSTFFDETEHIRPHIASENRWHWLMWGKGYDSCFCRGDEAILKGRTHVVGYPIVADKGIFSGDDKNVILFSLQFTHDWDDKTLFKAKSIVEKALQQLEGNNVRVLLRHHPRYNNSVSIDDLLQKYPFAELTTLSLQELASVVMLHITINSTTAFEYAELGTPSFFIDQNSMMTDGALFYDEYNYPLYKNMTISEVVERLQDKQLRLQDAKVVRKWYREFYDEFNEEEFLRVIEN